MEHHHQHTHTHGESNIKMAFFLNFGFTVFEIFGGIFTNSIAIISDAIHDMGDSLSLGLAWYFQKKSTKESDKNYTYGYKRFSLLGAIINSIILITGSIFVLYEAIPRLLHPETTKTQGMIVFAVIGIVVNGLAVLRLKKGSSINEKVVSLHMLEDVLGWAAILVGSLIMYFFDLPVIDPVLSVLITIYILFHVFRNVKESLHILLQGSPTDVDMEKISQLLLSIENVDEIHDLHIWSIDGNYNILTVHVVLKQPVTIEKAVEIKNKIRSELLQQGIEHATIEFETTEENCSLQQCC